MKTIELDNKTLSLICNNNTLKEMYCNKNFNVKFKRDSFYSIICNKLDISKWKIKNPNLNLERFFILDFLSKDSYLLKYNTNNNHKFLIQDNISNYNIIFDLCRTSYLFMIFLFECKNVTQIINFLNCLKNYFSKKNNNFIEYHSAYMKYIYICKYQIYIYYREDYDFIFQYIPIESFYIVFDRIEKEFGDKKEIFMKTDFKEL